MRFLQQKAIAERKMTMSQQSKFIPKEKLSKKTQKELNQSQRGSWGICNPVTKKVESKKKYNRKKVQKGDDILFEPSIFMLKEFTSFKVNDILSIDIHTLKIRKRSGDYDKNNSRNLV